MIGKRPSINTSQEVLDSSPLLPDKSALPCFGQRHLMVLLAHIGTGLVYCMRVSLSVALIAMVDTSDDANTSSLDNGTAEEVCVPPAIFNGPPMMNKSASVHMGEFDWSSPLQGLILSSFFWGYIITQMPSGLLTQQFSCKWLFGIGTLWTAVWTLLTPLAARTNVYWLLALRVLIGVGEGITLPAILSMLGKWAPPNERAFLYAVVSSATLGGTVLGQMLAGPMCESEWLGGWPSVFYIFGGVSILWVIPWAICTSDFPEEHPYISKAEKCYIKSTIGAPRSVVVKRPPVPWASLLSDGAVWAFSICAFAHGWIFYTFLTCLPRFLADVLHFNIEANGIISSLPYIFGFPVAILCAYCSDRIIEEGILGANVTRKLFNLFAYFAQAGCLIAIIYVGCDAWAAIGLLVAAFCIDGAVHGGYHPNALDHAPMFAGVIHGISNTLSTAAGIVAPAITNLIVQDHTADQWAVIFYVATGVAVVGGLSFWLFGSADLAKWAVVEAGEVTEGSVSSHGSSGHFDKSILKSVEAVSPEHYFYVEVPHTVRRPSILSVSMAT